MNHVLYEHPDGCGRIELSESTSCLVVTNDRDSTQTRVVIGVRGLMKLAESLQAVAIGEELK